MPTNDSISNLKEIDEKTGMWIKMLNNDSLIIDGTVPETTTFTLNPGWNLISYPSLSEKNVSVVFNQINSSLNNVLSYENNNWLSYSPLKNEFLNTLKKVKPGFGYWVDVNGNVSLVIS